jgi:hypothetical protein
MEGRRVNERYGDITSTDSETHSETPIARYSISLCSARPLIRVVASSSEAVTYI